MERSVAVWLVILLLALPSAHALCGESRIPLSQYNHFVTAIHDSNGVTDFNTLRSLFPAKVSKLDVNSTVLADPSLQKYYVDDFNGYAADPKSSDLYINRTTSKGGPFLLAGVVSSDLRIAKDTPNGPAYGKMLHEHYSGRAETSIWRAGQRGTAGLSSLAETSAIVTGMKSILNRSPRIVNVLRSGDFNVVIVCASNICNQEVYSLFTKYLNIGTSAEMFAEWGTTAVWNKVLPSSFKKNIRTAAMKLKQNTKVSSFIERWNKMAEHVPGMKKISTLQDQALDDIAKQSDEVKQAYLSCLTAGMCSDLENAEVLSKLTPEQRARLARAITESSLTVDQLAEVLNSPELRDKLDDFVRVATDPDKWRDTIGKYSKVQEVLGDQASKLDDIVDKLATGTADPKELENYLDELKSIYSDLPQSSKRKLSPLLPKSNKPASDRFAELVLDYAHSVRPAQDVFSSIHQSAAVEILAKQLEGAGYKDLAEALTAKDFPTFLATLDKMDDTQRARLVALLKNAKTSASNLGRVSTELQKLDPIDFGLAGAMREWTGDMMSEGAIRRVLKESIVIPGLMYVVRTGFLQTRQQIPGAVVGFSNLGALAGPFPVPKEWKFTRITPTAGTLGDDAFVDVLINGGSDPGDFFKTVLSSVFPWSALEDTIFRGHQPKILDAFVVGREQERMYSMGPSLVSLAVAEKSCPTCVISALGNGHFVLSASGASVTGSVVEAQRDDIGTTSIVFAHHSDIDFGDASVNIAEAAHNGESCEHKCAVVKSLRSISGSILGDPSRAAFVATLLESLGYTAFGPGFLVFDMPIQMKLYGGCHDCVDTWGGYYVHSFVPNAQASKESIIGSGSDPSKSVLDAVRRLVPVASLGGLQEELNKFASKIRANELEKGAPYVDFYLHNFNTGELYFTKIVEAVMASSEQMPSKYSEQGSIVLGKGKHRMIVNTKDGTVSMDGNVLISSPDHVRLYSVDPSIPGIVIPATLVVTSFEHSPAIVAHDTKRYNFEDNAFVSCVSSHFADINTGDITLKEAFGDLVEVHSTDGQITFNKDGAQATTAKWAGRLGLVDVDGRDKSYAVEGDTADFDVEGNQFTLTSKHRVLGMLDSVVFENGVVIRKGDYLLVWRKWLVRVLADDVAKVTMRPHEENGTVIPRFVPKPDASPQSVKDINRLNKLIKQMGGITSIDADRGYFQLFDKNGQLWMRFYDQDRNQYVEAPVNGMYQDPNDPSTFIVDTPNGQFHISLPTGPNGEVHLTINGNDLGTVTRMQGPKGALIYDPNTGTWSLLNGLIAGLNKAFSNGIKISFNGAGYANMTPANYANIYKRISPLHQRGISVPLFDGWELAVLLILVAAVYVAIQ